MDPIHKKVLDVLPSRKKERLIQYFTHTENRRSVEYIISDMYEPYLLVQKIMFPHAKYVVDKFHYIRYIMKALDDIRVKLQRNYGEKSKEYKLLKNKKNVALLRKYSNDIDWWVEVERYKNGHIVKVLPGEIIQELLSISDELRRGYQLKELFLDIVNHSPLEDAKRQLQDFIDLCRESNLEEFVEASNTIENWLEYIVNSFIDKRYTNGFTEGRNNQIKILKRISNGFGSFKYMRARLLYIFNKKLINKTTQKKSTKSKNKKIYKIQFIKK